MLTVSEAVDVVLPLVVEGVPKGVLGGLPLATLYLLRDKRSFTVFKGSFFDKVLGVRAFYVDNERWLDKPLCCLVCDNFIMNADGEEFYVIRHMNTNPNWLFKVMSVYVNSGSWLTENFGGPLKSGMHQDQIGLQVCVDCANAVMSCDPHELSLLSILLNKADKVYIKQVEKVAYKSLTWRERMRVDQEKAKARLEKKVAVAGVQHRVVAKFVLGPSGELVKVES
jgi:hypothetical protein